MINDFMNLANAAVVETGDSFKALPMILIIGAAVVALILSVAAKGKKSDDDDDDKGDEI